MMGIRIDGTHTPIIPIGRLDIFRFLVLGKFKTLESFRSNYTKNAFSDVCQCIVYVLSLLIRPVLPFVKSFVLTVLKRPLLPWLQRTFEHFLIHFLWENLKNITLFK